MSTKTTAPETGVVFTHPIYGRVAWRRPQELSAAQRNQARALDPSVKDLDGHLVLVTENAGRVVRIVAA